MAERAAGHHPDLHRPAHAGEGEVDITNLSALTAALGGIRTWAEIGAIVLFAAGGRRHRAAAARLSGAALHHADPSQIVGALIRDFHLIAPHIGVTLTELLAASRSAP